MDSTFHAFVAAKEINLNSLAGHFGVNKKFRWEDPLVLKGSNLAGIINDSEKKLVYVFYFGSIVFINFSHHEAMDILNYLYKIDKSINAIQPHSFQDDFKLVIDSRQTPTINYEDMVASSFEDYYYEIISTILAKSVALEKIESDMDKLFDDVEYIVDLLDRGRFNVSDQRLAKTASKILRYKFNSISYILLLDKPDITWVNEQAGTLYAELSTLFELDERFSVVQQKSETLMDVTQSFTGLTHATRGTRLEWMIIILIAFDIVLSLLEKIF